MEKNFSMDFESLDAQFESAEVDEFNYLSQESHVFRINMNMLDVKY